MFGVFVVVSLPQKLREEMRKAVNQFLAAVERALPSSFYPTTHTLSKFIFMPKIKMSTEKE